MSLLRLCSHLVPEHGAQVRLSPRPNVNTPFFQVPMPEFRHRTRARVQGLDLVLRHFNGVNILGTPCVNTTPFGAGVSGTKCKHSLSKRRAAPELTSFKLLQNSEFFENPQDLQHFNQHDISGIR